MSQEIVRKKLDNVVLVDGSVILTVVFKGSRLILTKGKQVINLTKEQAKSLAKAIQAKDW